MGSSLAAEAEVLQSHRCSRSMTPVDLASLCPDDAYAPAPKGCRCTSRTGYQRLRHTFDRDGRCLFCGCSRGRA